MSDKQKRREWWLMLDNGIGEQFILNEPVDTEDESVIQVRVREVLPADPDIDKLLADLGYADGLSTDLAERLAAAEKQLAELRDAAKVLSECCRELLYTAAVHNEQQRAEIQDRMTRARQALATDPEGE